MTPALQQQHERWAAAHARLRGKPAARVKPKRVHIPLDVLAIPREAAPVNLISGPDWKVILRLVALKHGVPSSQIMGPTRTAAISAARHEVCYLLAKHTRLSLPQIGNLLHRDHTTVLNSIRVHRKDAKASRSTC